MKILFIGGTGNISLACSRLVLEQGHDLYLLHRTPLEISGISLPGAREILCDIEQEQAVKEALGSQHFDTVVDWIAFKPHQVERDIRLFTGHTGQYVFISSASAYQKPPLSRIITENTPLANPYWQYSRDKIACEVLVEKEMRKGFPATIIRPSLTYSTVIPIPIGGWNEFTLVQRMRKGLPIVVHGDGCAPWTITHSDDFAQGFVPLLGHPQALGESFHITSDEHPNWIQIHQWLAEAAGTEARIELRNVDDIIAIDPEMTGSLMGDKAWPTIFDNSKLRTLVPGFQARISFRDGIRRTVEWFDADPRRQNINAQSNALIDKLLHI
jgi:nucleoside-diphosphate-sugar epimerase